MADAWLAARSIAWTLLLPGVVAGYVPWRYFGVRVTPPRDLWTAGAWILMLAGGLGLLVCVWEFAHRGRGTLAPVDPPKTLVVTGLYRHVRNPMYLGVTLVLLGEALLVRERGLVLYWAVWFAAVNAFVLLYEEPTLRREFGEQYERYAACAGRWLPRMRREEQRLTRRPFTRRSRRHGV